MYLRCFTGDRPREWLRWLPWAEYTYNTAYQSSLHDTPFHAVYGRQPPSIWSYEAGDTRVAAMAKTMVERAVFLEDVRHRLEQAQVVQKRFYDNNHQAVAYEVGDWVLLRLRNRPVASMSLAPKGKLQPRFFGPYYVTEIINDTAVRLALPPQAKIHDVFHVGLLKKWVGAPPTSTPELPELLHGAVMPEPERVVHFRLAKGVKEVPVRWKGQPASASTWEDWGEFIAKHPSFQLEDELRVGGGERCHVGSPLYPSEACKGREARRRACSSQGRADP
jgi:hypothetical protein